MPEGLKTQFVQKYFRLRGLITDDTFEIEPDGQDNQRGENHLTFFNSFVSIPGADNCGRISALWSTRLAMLLVFRAVMME
jgi:hypothetical protein